METNKLFVWGLSWGLAWQDLKDAFSKHWEVVFARVVTDRETWRSRGFWFVEFSSVEDAVKAKEAMDWTELDWRSIKVDFAQDKREETQEQKEES